MTRDTTPGEALVREIRAAYASSADGWAAGPALVYRQLAAALVTAADRALTGCLVLDLGAGTGVASEALTDVGARPVGVDLALEMLTHRRAQRPPGVAGDAQALPFRAGVFDAVVAAFSLNHVPDLEGALGECRRVVRSGGTVLASTFPNHADHPAKAAVESVLEDWGYRRPDWYATLKARLGEVTGDAAILAQLAARAGLTDVHVERMEVEAGLDDPRVAVEWRLNMPHTIGFVAALDPNDGARLRAAAVAALRDDHPSSVPMLALRGRVP